MCSFKSVIALSLAFSLGLLFSQAQDNRILYTSKEVSQSETRTPRITSIADRAIHNFLTVKYEDGLKKRIANSEVWGYIADGKLYRRYKRDFLEVISQNDVVKYRPKPISKYDVITKSTPMVERPYLFSKSLDGKIYSSEKAVSEVE